MRKINYRLIVSDFDGTLLDSKHNIPDGVKATISEYVASGGIFAVCTGRMPRSILPRVRELGLKGLVVAYQGTVIAEIESGKLIKDGGLSAEQTAEICRAVESFPSALNVYSGECLYTDIPKDNKYLRLYENITGVEAIGVTGMKMSQYVEENNLICQKVASLVASSDREKLFSYLTEKLADKFDVTCSADVLVEISPLGDNKGKAVEYLADYFGIPLSSAIAIGDNLNDMPMIKTAGIGVAVGNATEALKQAADVVTVTNDEGAVAKIIEKYGFV